MFSFEMKVHPFERQKDRRDLFTPLTFWFCSSLLVMRPDIVSFVEGDSCSIDLARSTIFSPSFLGSSVDRLLVQICKMISSGFRRLEGFTKSDMSSTVHPLKDLEETCFVFESFLPCIWSVNDPPYTRKEAHWLSKDDYGLLIWRTIAVLVI